MAQLRVRGQHRQQQLLRLYADWRVQARRAETHNSTDSVVFTFDDFGTPEQIERILAILDHTNVRAVFFIQGDWAASHRAELEAIRAAGHIIGNHTFSHPDLLSLTDEQVVSELSRGPKSQWLRPPRGRYNNRIRRIAASLGMTIKYWSLDSDDWQGLTSEVMHDKIMRNIHPSAVILFHLHGQHTIELLPGLINDIRARGLNIAASGEPIWDEAA